MKAIVLKEAGAVDNLVVSDIDSPVVMDDEVLIQSKAISVNPVDAKVRVGKSIYNELKGQNDVVIPGWDISGIVIETGSKVTKFKKGDEVFGMVNFPGHGRAYAQFVAAPEDHIALKPSNVSHDEAAAATLAALTAWQALVTHAKVKSGQKVIIQAAAGGVGHYAVQIAKHFGAYVIGTSSAANKDFVLSLGADEHIDHKMHQIDEVVNDADFVLDAIGGANIDHSLNAIKKNGLVIMLPTMYRDQLEEKARIKGVKGLVIVVSSNGEDMQQIADLLAKGVIKSHVSKVFRLDEVRDAHQQIESGKTVGKIVMRAD